MTKRDPDRQNAATGTPIKRKFQSFPAGLFAEWVVIAVVCAALLLLSGVLR